MSNYKTLEELLAEDAPAPDVPNEQPSVDEEMTRTMLTDAGNAQAFARDHGESLRWVPQWGSWLRYDGARWVRTPSESMIKLGIMTARGFYARAAEPGLDPEIARALANHARQTESASKLEAMIRLARGFLIEPATSFDADPFALNVANGTIDLRTGLLRPHRRDDMLTMMSPLTFDPRATCPQWDAFLARVLPDAEVRAFVQRFAGHCLTGDVSEQVLAFFFGRGANGKSTAIEMLLYVLGDYGKAGAPDLLLAKNSESHPTEQADLKGSRMVVCQEVEAGRSWAERTIKQLTGGDRLKARLMRCDFFEFQPTHKIIVAANHRPKVRGQDEGIWRRIKLVPFGVTIPPEQRDKTLLAKLRGEASGILAWCVRGCLAWQREGLGDPPAVNEATNAYRAEQDHIGHFVDDLCELDPAAFTATNALYTAYHSWCARHGDRPWARDAFRENLLEHTAWGLADHRTKGARGIKGIRLRVCGAPILPSIAGDAGDATDRISRLIALETPREETDGGKGVTERHPSPTTTSPADTDTGG